MSIIDWISEHYQEAIAALATGGAGGFFGKKAMDAKQIKRLDDMDKQIAELKKNIEINTLFDKDLRVRIEKHEIEINKKLDRIDDKQDALMKFILELKR